MDINISLKHLRREAGEYSVKPKLSLIPVHIARKISSDFPWSHSHGDLIFSAKNAAALSLLEQFTQNPETQVAQADLTVIKEAFVNTFAVFQDRIEEVLQQYPDLKAHLGDSYTDIVKIFLKGIELVELIERGEVTLERIKAMEGELELGRLSLEEWKSLITTNYNRLISYFCAPGWRLRAEIEIFLSSLGIVHPSVEDAQWSFQKDRVRYTVRFEDNILSNPRLWFKRERMTPGLVGLLSGMVQNSLRYRCRNIIITFFEIFAGESLGNFGFSIADDGEGFKDVSCLDESKAIPSFAKEYSDALVIVESNGKECDYVVTSERVMKFTSESECDQTRVTLLLPVDQADEKVWRIVRKRFKMINKQIEAVKKKYYEADYARKKLNDNRLAIARYEEILKLLEGKEDKDSLNLIAQCYHRIGNCYIHFGQLKKTLVFHEKAYQLIEELYKKGWLEPGDERYKFFHSSSVRLIDCYAYKAAEQRLKESLLPRKEYGLSRSELSRVRGSLGQLYTFWGRLYDAEEMLLEALEGIRDDGDINGTIQDGNYLAMLYIKMNKYQKAEGIFKGNLQLLRDDMSKAHNATYIYYGLSKLYYHWGLKEKSEAKYQEAIKYADEGLDWYGDEYSDLGKDYYPKGLMLRFKGCALRELNQFDKAETCLKESYVYLENLGSPNISVIGAAARLELAQLYIHRDRAGDLDNAKGQVARSIEVINAFDVDSATAYFRQSITNLNDALQHLGFDDKMAASNLIQAFIEHIPY